MAECPNGRFPDPEPGMGPAGSFITFVQPATQKTFINAVEAQAGKNLTQEEAGIAMIEDRKLELERAFL